MVPETDSHVLTVVVNQVLDCPLQQTVKVRLAQSHWDFGSLRSGLLDASTECSSIEERSALKAIVRSKIREGMVHPATSSPVLLEARRSSSTFRTPTETLAGAAPDRMQVKLHGGKGIFRSRGLAI
jgi:hypothetical protein